MHVLRMDSVQKLDASVFRSIPINERTLAQLRFEGYNVFNAMTDNAPSVIFGRVLGERRVRGVGKSSSDLLLNR